MKGRKENMNRTRMSIFPKLKANKRNIAENRINSCSIVLALPQDTEMLIFKKSEA